MDGLGIRDCSRRFCLCSYRIRICSGLARRSGRRGGIDFCLTSIRSTSCKFHTGPLGGKNIAQCIDPQRVCPARLGELEKCGGAALYSSSHWASTEALRITALTGYRSAVHPAESEKYWKKQEEMMLLLGSSRQPITQYIERRAEVYV